MRKLIFLLSFSVSVFAFSQSKYTAEQVEKSTDPKVIANFIKYNPDHPKTPEFKRKLFATLNNDKPTAQKAAVAKPKIAPLTTEKVVTVLKKQAGSDEVKVTKENPVTNTPAKAVAKGPTDAKTQKTVALLNHLFNSDPNSREAIIQIVNRSKCNLIVKISGSKFYNLSIPASNNNFIMVQKGTYTLTTSVCDAKYSSVKNVDKDLVITLNSPGGKVR